MTTPIVPFSNVPLHVLIPFNREDMVGELLGRYLTQRHTVILHPLCCTEAKAACWPADPCILPIVLPSKVPRDGCYGKLNRFAAELRTSIPDDHYCIAMCDDDWLSDLPTLADETADVIFTTMHFGYREPSTKPKGASPGFGKGTGAEWWALPRLAEHKNMRNAWCGMGNAIFRAGVLAKHTWRLRLVSADGRFVQDLRDDPTLTKSYRPDFNYMWNYMQPGRWAAPSIDDTEPYVPLDAQIPA